MLLTIAKYDPNPRNEHGQHVLNVQLNNHLYSKLCGIAEDFLVRANLVEVIRNEEYKLVVTTRGLLVSEKKRAGQKGEETFSVQFNAARFPIVRHISPEFRLTNVTFQLEEDGIRFFLPSCKERIAPRKQQRGKFALAKTKPQTPVQPQQARLPLAEPKAAAHQPASVSVAQITEAVRLLNSNVPLIGRMELDSSTNQLKVVLR